LPLKHPESILASTRNAFLAMADNKVKVPKAVQKFMAGKEYLTTVDLEKASQQERSALLNAFYYTTPKGDQKRKEYTSLKTDADRRQWLGTWVMAAAQGKSTGWNSSEVTVTSTDGEEGEWVTEQMLAGPQYLNCPHAAKTYITTAASRPYKHNAALAEAGVLEYRYVKDKDSNARASKSTAGVKTESNLTEEEYGEVNASMQVAFETKGPPQKKLKTTTAPKKPHPVFAKLSVARKNKEKALRTIRDTAEKISTDLDKVQTTKDKLANKGWPNALQEMLQAASDKVRATVENVLSMWGKEILDATVRLPDEMSGKESQLHESQVQVIEDMIKEIDTKTVEFDSTRKRMESEHKSFCTGTLADMLKIS
jgi:hypothetical protein